MIETRIREQINKFMPVVSVINIQFSAAGADSNTLGIALTYGIPDIGITEMLEFTI